MRSCTAPPPFLCVTQRRRWCYEAVSRHLRTLYTQFIYRVQPKTHVTCQFNCFSGQMASASLPPLLNTRADILPSTRHIPAPQCSSVPLAISWTTSAAAFIAAECATTMIVLLERSLCNETCIRNVNYAPNFHNYDGLTGYNHFSAIASK
jgi:hypothetical protein